jgi:hypothetical protein
MKPNPLVCASLVTVAMLFVVACGETVDPAIADWNALLNVPTGFADGTDDVGNYTAGPGLTLSGPMFGVAFGGDGTENTVAHSDHVHDYSEIQNRPGPEGWIKLESVARTNSTTFSFMNLDGNAYRRFRIEIEGVVGVAGSDRVIVLRPNAVTTSYGPSVMHMGAHEPGVSFHHGVTNFGAPPDNALPICVTHFNQDGHVMCTSEMNSETGRMRLVTTNAVFATALTTCGTPGNGCISQDTVTAVWRDTAANITSMEISFPSITTFVGDVTLWALK